MKLIRARFQNFRLLRDLTLDFSTDPQRRLTVIRAENKTGKTTILNALQWALYGDGALPGNRNSYRLHHWDVPNNQQVDITVEVDFSAATRRYNQRSRRHVTTEKEYRIVRAVTETPREGNGWDRGPSTVILYEDTEGGFEQIPNPDARIENILAPELREVFFTDSDRALSFIESDATRRIKRERVEGAVRSLLGFDVIESAIGHVKTTANQVNEKVLQSSSSKELEEVQSRLQQIEDEVEALNHKMIDAEQQYNTFQVQLEEIDIKILEAVSKGDRVELENEITSNKRHLERIYAAHDSTRKEHSLLFRDLPLYRELLDTVLNRSFAKLDELSDRGKIPNATIPVLEERLSSTACICGESLSPSDEDSVRRREHIRHLIEQSQAADDLSRLLTELFYGSTSLRHYLNDGAEDWSKRYYGVQDRRDTLVDEQKEAEQKQKALEIRLDQIPDTDVVELRNTMRNYQRLRDRFRDILVECETQLNSRNREKPALVQRRNRLTSEQVQDQDILAMRDVTEDIHQVLENAYKRITVEELAKVSCRMDNLFLKMVVADPAEGSDIRRAEISEDFDIRVYSGVENRTVNPDLDLSGASRRALTMAFILALMRVSEVKAPSIIDTPLGMMSGLIRRSALKTAIEESSQIVLFLTRSEVEGCEDLLNEEAGKFITLINGAHYPMMLVNDPGVVGSQAIRCRCDDLGFCNICEIRSEQFAQARGS